MVLDRFIVIGFYEDPTVVPSCKAEPELVHRFTRLLENDVYYLQSKVDICFSNPYNPKRSVSGQPVTFDTPEPIEYPSGCRQRLWLIVSLCFVAIMIALVVYLLTSGEANRVYQERILPLFRKSAREDADTEAKTGSNEKVDSPPKLTAKSG